MARSRSGTPAALAGLGDELETIRDDLARLGEHVARMMRSTGSDAVDETRAQVHRMIADAGSRGRDAAHAMRNAGEQIGGALEHSVRTRPFATVALALGLGIVIGAIYRR